MLDQNVNLVNPSAERLLFSEEKRERQKARARPNFVDIDEELVRKPKTISMSNRRARRKTDEPRRGGARLVRAQ
jgi:hypothetical protein